LGSRWFEEGHAVVRRRDPNAGDGGGILARATAAAGSQCGQNVLVKSVKTENRIKKTETEFCGFQFSA